VHIVVVECHIMRISISSDAGCGPQAWTLRLSMLDIVASLPDQPPSPHPHSVDLFIDPGWAPVPDQAAGQGQLCVPCTCRQEAYRRRRRARQVQQDADPNLTDQPEPDSPAGAGARAPPAAEGLWKVPARGQPGQIAATPLARPPVK